jgi:hypothetical protein
LNPVPESHARFKRQDFRYRSPQIDATNQTKKHSVVMGIDPAWVSSERIRSGDAKRADYSTVATILVDPAYNIYLMDIFREHCTVAEFADELWRQWVTHNAALCGVENYDLRHCQAQFDQHSFQTKVYVRFEPLTRTNTQSKDDRIEGTLEGLVRSHKLFLYHGLPWLEDEFARFPHSKTKDGLDAIVNAVKVASVPRGDFVQKPTQSATEKHINDLLKGRLKRSISRWKNAY